MRASRSQPAAKAPQTTPPLPLPLPLPPPPLSLPSPATATSPLSSSLPSSPATSPRSSTTASSSLLVPFSWERHPGVPKNYSSRGSGGVGSPTTGAPPPLPLPPPLLPSPRRHRHRRRASVDAAAASLSSGATSNNCDDPFVAAFAECTRDGHGDDHGADANTDVAAAEDGKLWVSRARTTKPAAAASSSARAERRWWLAAGFVGFLDLYGCKSALAVADGAFLARRPGVAHHGRRASPRR